MKAKIIAVAAQKGGIGKTTTSVNLASCVAMRASPVLLIDLDPQGSTMDWVAMMEQNQLKFFDYLKSVEADIESLLRKNVDHYKYIIIDCPPRLDKIMAKVLKRADLILTPVGLGAMEHWAFDDFNQTVQHHQSLNNGKPKHSIFFSNVDIRCKRLIAQTASSVAKMNISALGTIHTRQCIIEAPSLGKCTIHMNDEKATFEIETLTTHVLEQLEDIPIIKVLETTQNDI